MKGKGDQIEGTVLPFAWSGWGKHGEERWWPVFGLTFWPETSQAWRRSAYMHFTAIFGLNSLLFIGSTGHSFCLSEVVESVGWHFCLGLLNMKQECYAFDRAVWWSKFVVVHKQCGVLFLLVFAFFPFSVIFIIPLRFCTYWLPVLTRARACVCACLRVRLYLR